MDKMTKHQKQARTGRAPYAKGGKVHDDAAMDKALIKKELKGAKIMPKAKGGRAGKC
jgi:hypothetical protein